MALVEKDLGAEGKLKLDFVGGKVRLDVSYDGKQADAGLYVELDASQFIDMLTEAIPGTLDDMIGAALKGAIQ